MKRMGLLIAAALAFYACEMASQARAQTYPARPIRLVVPFGAGGGTDNLARIIEPFISKALGQPLIIDNRPGAGSVIGMDAVAKSASDGYTLVMTDTSIAVNPEPAEEPAVRHAEGFRTCQSVGDCTCHPGGAS